MPTARKTDQERIADLEARVAALEADAEDIRQTLGNQLLRGMKTIAEAMGIDLSDDAPELQIASPHPIELMERASGLDLDLGLGLPPIETRPPRRRRKER